jgi:hypothetical protein
VSLKPKTTYVLQVVNASLCYDAYNTDNIISTIDNKFSYTFDNYLFFESGEEVNYILSINGIGFGYTIYGKDIDGIVKDLRCIKSPIQSKVFLFEAQQP